MPLMPIEKPWRTVFQPGDYIFGYANTITEFTEKHRAEGATENDKIQSLATDRAEAFDGKGKSADKQSFYGALEQHPKYSAILSDSSKDVRAPALAGMKPGAVKNNRAWRIKSKGSLYWATMAVKKHVHFILDDIDMEEVIKKNHTDGPVHGQDTGPGTAADAKTRTITHAELRWIYRNKILPEVRAHVQFWLNNQCCVAPWQSEPGLWSQYVPKHSLATPGIEYELD